MNEFWAAITGAVVGGLFVILAQLISNVAQRRSDRETERRVINGTLKAIKAELNVLKTGNFDPLQKELQDRAREREELRTNKRNPLPPLVMRRTEQNYLIVFESNAAALGRIDDENLREKIISVYVHAKVIFDALNHHSVQFDRWDRLPPNYALPATSEKQEVESMLEAMEDGILNGLGRFQEGLAELIPHIEKYLKRAR